MTDKQLTELFERVHQEELLRRRRKVEAIFYPYRSLRHTIEWTPWRIRVKVSQYFRGAPIQILEYAAIILLSKVYKLPVDREISRTYRIYLDRLHDEIPQSKRKHPGGYSSFGSNFDLQRLFDDLNREYFENKIQRPILGWSKGKSYTRLGFYDAKRNLLVVSRIFDQPSVPEQVLRYLLFHEMLHIFYPTIRREERRIIHSAEFKKTEHRFPGFIEIQKWIKKHVRKL
jgi:hypothetical protein